MDHPSFGRWLKLRRGGLGLTQAQLGGQIGYAGETIRDANWLINRASSAPYSSSALSHWRKERALKQMPC